MSISTNQMAMIFYIFFPDIQLLEHTVEYNSSQLWTVPSTFNSFSMNRLSIIASATLVKNTIHLWIIHNLLSDSLHLYPPSGEQITLYSMQVNNKLQFVSCEWDSAGGLWYGVQCKLNSPFLACRFWPVSPKWICCLLVPFTVKVQAALFNHFVACSRRSAF